MGRWGGWADEDMERNGETGKTRQRDKMGKARKISRTGECNGKADCDVRVN